MSPGAAKGAGEGRRLLISGNWKMNHDHFQAIATVQRLLYRLGPPEYAAAEVSIHPPFTDLRSIQVLLENDDPPIALGAQHCYWEDSGAFTGEISPVMLQKLGVRYVIAGHSERRMLFGDTDETVARRARAILDHSMVPIICVGETEAEREEGRSIERITSQVKGSLAGLSPEEIAGSVIAYEPIWAIGTGRTATPEDAQEGCAAVRTEVASIAGETAANSLRVQYGGSVKPANAKELMDLADVDGVLVGGASLDADAFAEIVSAVAS